MAVDHYARERWFTGKLNLFLFWLVSIASSGVAISILASIGYTGVGIAIALVLIAVFFVLLFLALNAPGEIG
jgi:hypothetical protein